MERKIIMFSPSPILINGNLVESDSSYAVSVFSPSFQYGLNVFEGIRVYVNEKKYYPFLLDQHINRLIESSKLLMINDTPDGREIENDINLLSIDRSESGKGLFNNSSKEISFSKATSAIELTKD